MGLVYIDGELVAREEARISPFDRGFLYGYGLFETVRSYGGHIFGLDRHLARLMHSANKVGLDAGLDLVTLKHAINMTLKANKCMDARIRLTVSAGVGDLGLIPPVSGRPTTIVVVEELILPSPEAYKNGISAAVVSVKRNSKSPLSGMKSINYLDSLIARAEAVATGAEQAILLNDLGFVAECSTSNIFIVAGGQLLTPSLESGILPGITREMVLELAQGLGIVTVVNEILLESLFHAEELFLTNSIVEIVPITKVDSKPVGLGKPGVVTKKLMGAYRELVRQQTNSI